jgi:predicted lipoprotein with Yx(FWY)xxD motif
MKNLFTSVCLTALLGACAGQGGSYSTGGYGSSDYGSAPAPAPKVAAAPAHAHMTAGLPLMVKDGMVVTKEGLTVYTFDKDAANSGKSACNGDCAVKWPPVLASATDKPEGAFTIVMRDDGRRQWAYRGKPVYTWPEDQEPGDKYGDNKMNIWHVVRQ